MIYPLVLELAATDAPTRVPVTVTCRVLGFSPQAFYQWRKNPVCERDLHDAYLTNAAVDLHLDDPEFGYRLIADDLKAAGHQVSENRVWRLCSQQRLWSVHSKKRGPNRKPGPPVHDDLLLRKFTATAAVSDLVRLLGDAVQREDTAVLVVGYAFADPHINRLLLRSLATNPALNVFVADPMAVLEPRSARDRCRVFLGAMTQPMTSPGPNNRRASTQLVRMARRRGVSGPHGARANGSIPSTTSSMLRTIGRG